MRLEGSCQRHRRAIRLVTQCHNLCNNCQGGIFNDAASCQGCATSASKELLFWMKLTGQNCPSATLFPTNLPWTELGSEPSLRGQQPVTNRLSQSSCGDGTKQHNSTSENELGQDNWPLHGAATRHLKTLANVQQGLVAPASGAGEGLCGLGTGTVAAGARIGTLPAPDLQWSLNADRPECLLGVSRQHVAGGLR